LSWQNFVHDSKLAFQKGFVQYSPH
jgi:hypothetical protein